MDSENCQQSLRREFSIVSRLYKSYLPRVSQLALLNFTALERAGICLAQAAARTVIGKMEMGEMG